MILNKLINKVKLIPSVVRGVLLRFRVQECGRRVLISKGLELHKRNALIHIGKHVWIVHHVIINKGVTIGDGAVIASGQLS